MTTHSTTFATPPLNATATPGDSVAVDMVASSLIPASALFPELSGALGALRASGAAGQLLFVRFPCFI
eukprot:m.177046 g.177046  ORF g.177046 m.177046 type:complete len:68 (+) comp17958_c0_seq3:980-1183(+)